MVAKEITFQELIERVKTELFSPAKSIGQEGKSVYPIFYVDGVELELKFDLTQEANGGFKLSLPAIVEASADAAQKETGTHSMKITLKPLLTLEEMRELVKKDTKIWNGVEKASRLAMFKGSDDLAGKEE